MRGRPKKYTNGVQTTVYTELEYLTTADKLGISTSEIFNKALLEAIRGEDTTQTQVEHEIAVLRQQRSSLDCDIAVKVATLKEVLAKGQAMSIAEQERLLDEDRAKQHCKSCGSTLDENSENGYCKNCKWEVLRKKLSKEVKA